MQFYEILGVIVVKSKDEYGSATLYILEDIELLFKLNESRDIVQLVGTITKLKLDVFVTILLKLLLSVLVKVIV